MSVIYMVSVRSPSPVMKIKQLAEKRLLMIENPFCPGQNILSAMLGNAYHYIIQQLVAAYAYFGVPRLAMNGRHLFTKVNYMRPIAQSGESRKRERSESSDVASEMPAKRGQKPPSKMSIPILPLIDDSDSFSSNLTKVSNEMAAEFFDRNRPEQEAGKVEEVSSVLEDPECLTDLSKMLPHLAKTVLRQTFEENHSQSKLPIYPLLMMPLTVIVDYISRKWTQSVEMKSALSEKPTCNAKTITDLSLSIALKFWTSLHQKFIQNGIFKVQYTDSNFYNY
ncbi:Terminal uridylyltransferase 4 [Cichlidogyrus casuarinus]|uniref:Terminal uridylyltransferase 4 n=1 Tax=Cichlidogyrus casuarinus TaxID=1844966 RepID=A0ABD2QJI2_9PLAT